jgi:hypothetical protein
MDGLRLVCSEGLHLPAYVHIVSIVGELTDG